MKILLVLLVSMISVSTFASTKMDCNYINLEKQLVENYGLSADQAHGYRLAVESFIFNLNVALVTGFKMENVYDGNLESIKYDLVNSFGVTENRAEIIVASMKLIRLNKDESGVVLKDGPCVVKRL
jgi:hypothetical protein